MGLKYLVRGRQWMKYVIFLLVIKAQSDRD